MWVSILPVYALHVCHMHTWCSQRPVEVVVSWIWSYRHCEPWCDAKNWTQVLCKSSKYSYPPRHFCSSRLHPSTQALNLLCSWECHWTLEPPVSTPQVAGSQGAPTHTLYIVMGTEPGLHACCASTLLIDLHPWHTFDVFYLLFLKSWKPSPSINKEFAFLVMAKKGAGLSTDDKLNS